MRSIINHLSIFTGVILLPLLLTACGEETAEEGRDVGARPIKLVTITAATNRVTRTFPAVIDVIQSADLAFQVGGLIEQLSVIEAQKVAEGDVIAQLEQRVNLFLALGGNWD